MSNRIVFRLRSAKGNVLGEKVFEIPETFAVPITRAGTPVLVECECFDQKGESFVGGKFRRLTTDDEFVVSDFAFRSTTKHLEMDFGKGRE